MLASIVFSSHIYNNIKLKFFCLSHTIFLSYIINKVCVDFGGFVILDDGAAVQKQTLQAPRNRFLLQHKFIRGAGTSSR